MTTKLNPYVSFKENTRQAMDFYQTVFGGKHPFGINWMVNIAGSKG